VSQGTVGVLVCVPIQTERCYYSYMLVSFLIGMLGDVRRVVASCKLSECLVLSAVNGPVSFEPLAHVYISAGRLAEGGGEALNTVDNFPYSARYFWSRNSSVSTVIRLRPEWYGVRTR
jgi:hypothetical protein